MVINLAAAASVSLAIKKDWDHTTTNTGSQACQITTPIAGVATYPRQATDFPQEGRYIGDVKIVYIDGSKPEHLHELVVMIARAANS